ncbi:glycosyltransferase family 2 protein [Psychroserpens sp.]|uniref:glycosyltransferase family 2 protein n=1 Tax=Psychroserpens sp. TaxID=2020870 RepID=UPI003C766856
MRRPGISTIIIFHGRFQHLLMLLSGLEQGNIIPNEVILIEMDVEKSIIPNFELPINHILLPISNSSNLPIAEARNLGAIWSKFEILTFLDVDCIPSKEYISEITNIKLKNNAIYMGYPKYLEVPINEIDFDFLSEKSIYHPLRPNQECIRKIDDYGMFWSLTFFLNYKTFSAIDGFDTLYSGYGAEDTDFAFKAQALNMDFYITPFKVYHQQHSFCRPPLNSMKAIVKNSNHFYKKWQFWPMENYLRDFADRELISWNRKQTKPIEVTNHPSKSEIENSRILDEPYA